MSIENLSPKEFRNELEKEASEKENFIVHHFEETLYKLGEYFEEKETYRIDKEKIKGEERNFEKCVFLLFELASEYANKMNRVIDIGSDDSYNEIEEYFYFEWDKKKWIFKLSINENGVTTREIVSETKEVNKELLNSHLAIKEYFDKKLESRRKMLKLLKNN